jgi:ribosomal protein S18 acetylase RimI-like enzyme
MTLSVRHATANDVPALGRLGALLVAAHHGFDQDRFISPGPQSERGYGAFLKSQLGRTDVVVLVAEEAGEVVGYAYGALEGQDWMILRGPAGAVYDLVVDPERRRGGVGRRLLEAIVERLRELGAPRIVLSAAYRNETAQRLFTSAGFRPTMVEMTRELEQAHALSPQPTSV